MLHISHSSSRDLHDAVPLLLLDFPQRVELAFPSWPDDVFLHALQIAAMILMLVVIKSDAEQLVLSGASSLGDLRPHPPRRSSSASLVVFLFASSLLMWREAGEAAISFRI